MESSGRQADIGDCMAFDLCRFRRRERRFSILHRTPPELEIAEVIALEGTWTERLGTREFGFNRT